VATSVWHQGPRESDLIGDHVTEGTESSEAHLRRMRLVRQFVSRVIEEQGGGSTSALTDDDWSRLCRTAQDAESDEAAIARVVMQAYGLKAGGSVPEATEPVPAPLPTVPDVPLASQHTSDPFPTPWPVPVDGSTRPLISAAPDPVPVSPLEPIPVSFAGKAWPVIDEAGASLTQPSPGFAAPAPAPAPAQAPATSPAGQACPDEASGPASGGAAFAGQVEAEAQSYPYALSLTETESGPVLVYTAPRDSGSLAQLKAVAETIMAEHAIGRARLIHRNNDMIIGLSASGEA